MDEQRLLQEIGAAQSLAELHALMPEWGAWFDQQKDGAALDAAMARIHSAWDERLAALNADGR